MVTSSLRMAAIANPVYAERTGRLTAPLLTLYGVGFRNHQWL